MLGGVSEEQAAEAAHQQSKNVEGEEEQEEVVENGEEVDAGDGDGVEAGGVEPMEEDEEQVTTNNKIVKSRCNMK